MRATRSRPASKNTRSRLQRPLRPLNGTSTPPAPEPPAACAPKATPSSAHPPSDNSLISPTFNQKTSRPFTSTRFATPPTSGRWPKINPKANLMRPKPKPNPLVFLTLDQLRTHPRNMNQFYPPESVQEMADSLRDRKGNVQAMLVVPADAHATYYVVDGNRRLASGRLLGQQCPPFKCEIDKQPRAEHLLPMPAPTLQRYPPDPIPEARHYRNLLATAM